VSDHLDRELREELDRYRAAGLLRSLRAEGPTGNIDFTSNDYLGLAIDPRVVEAGREALARHGAGSRAARLLGGECPLHAELEAAVCEWQETAACLLFPSGYQANLGLVSSLVGPGDTVFSDELNHASLIDAARLSRGAVRVFAHKDMRELERMLATARTARRRLVVSETIFSMDGDLAPLDELEALCERYDAWLILDEAHAVGMLGEQGRGARSERPGGRVVARVLTGGKSLGVSGALVTGSADLVQTLLQRARSFMFTTAPSPAISGALLKAVEICRGADDLRAAVLQRARELAAALELPAPDAAIVPVPVGSAQATMELAARLREDGFNVRGVRPPTVPEGSSRLRLTCGTRHTSEEVLALAAAIRVHRTEAITLPARERKRQATPWFVAGTDTEVGKTVVSALLMRAAKSAGPAVYWKPVQTGDDSDTQTVARLADLEPGERSKPLWELELPASPHEAARHAGIAIDFQSLPAALGELRSENADAACIVELAGGLLVPYDDTHLQIDWLERERPRLVLVARSGLGTLNHTLLSVEALRARHLTPNALFLVGPRHASNRETLERMAGIPHVYEVELFDPLDTSALDSWLERHGRLSLLFDS